jgi:lysophospholipase L1-like esterase
VPVLRQLFAAAAIAVTCAAAGCGSSPPAAPSPPDEPPVTTPDPEPPNPPAPQPVIPTIRYTTFLTFGDSNTEGESTPASHNPGTPGVERSYPFKLSTLLTARYANQTISVFNGGRSGERATASSTIARLEELLKEFRPDVLIVMHGVNDLNTGVSIDATVGAIEELLGEGRRHGVQMILCTIPPQREGAEKAFAADLIAPFNEALVKIAADEGAVVVDVYAAITPDLLAPDGLHLTQAGNQKIAETIFNKLKELYEVPMSAGPVRAGAQ